MDTFITETTKRHKEAPNSNTDLDTILSDVVTSLPFLIL